LTQNAICANFCNMVEDSGDEKKLVPIPIRDDKGNSVGEGYQREIVEEITPWSQFKLDDGTIIKIKVLVLSVLRTDQYTPSGEPIYSVKSHNVTISQSPEDLKKPLISGSDQKLDDEQQQ